MKNEDLKSKMNNSQENNWNIPTMSRSKQKSDEKLIEYINMKQLPMNKKIEIKSEKYLIHKRKNNKKTTTVNIKMRPRRIKDGIHDVLSSHLDLIYSFKEAIKNAIELVLNIINGLTKKNKNIHLDFRALTQKKKKPRQNRKKLKNRKHSNQH
jgi:hypothetical protein